MAIGKDTDHIMVPSVSTTRPLGSIFSPYASHIILIFYIFVKSNHSLIYRHVLALRQPAPQCRGAFYEHACPRLAGEGVGMSYTDRHGVRTAGQSMRRPSPCSENFFEHMSIVKSMVNQLILCVCVYRDSFLAKQKKLDHT